MYKVIIVDDELLVQIGIKSMINWDKEDITIIGMASNGEQAYELIKKEMPDIVITDIKMPVMDGLELIRKCKENMEILPRFILLTSHEDFTYAKNAVKLGAVEYLIKLELNEDMLLEALRLAKSHIKHDKIKGTYIDNINHLEISNENIFNRLINNLIDEMEIPNIMSQICMSLEEDLFILCFDIKIRQTASLSKSEEGRIYDCVINTTFELVNKEYKSHVVPTDKSNYYAVIYYKNEINQDVLKRNIQELIDRIIHVNGEYFNVNVQVGCSKFSYDMVNIPTAYNEARQALNYIQESNTSVFYSDIEQYRLNVKTFDVTIFTKQIDIAIKHGDANGVHIIFEKLMDLFKAENPVFEQTIDCCYKLMYFILSTIENGEQIIDSTLSGNISGYTHIGNMKNVGEVLEWLTELSDSICEEISTQDIDYSKRIVVKAKAYVNEKIFEKLSLNEVAEELGISSGYLSVIFKRYNELGFSDYVSKCKIEYAMNILKEGKYKIYEVAEIVGYENAYYFSKVFKKIVGITPKEYISRLN